MASASEQAYKAIRDMILDGALGEGAPLREESLAAQLDVSRTPVREALRRLDAEGLVILETNRGAKVRSWPAEAINEMFELRALLEGRGARTAAGRADSSSTDALDGMAAQMLRLSEDPGPKDFDQIATLNNRFHNAVLELSDSSQLRQLRDDLVQLPLVRRTFQRYSPRALARSMRHHVELVDALRAGDADWAEAVMRAHILGARHALQDRTDEADPTT